MGIFFGGNTPNTTQSQTPVSTAAPATTAPVAAPIEEKAPEKKDETVSMFEHTPKSDEFSSLDAPVSGDMGTFKTDEAESFVSAKPISDPAPVSTMHPINLTEKTDLQKEAATAPIDEKVEDGDDEDEKLDLDTKAEEDEAIVKSASSVDKSTSGDLADAEKTLKEKKTKLQDDMKEIEQKMKKIEAAIEKISTLKTQEEEILKMASEIA